MTSNHQQTDQPLSLETLVAGLRQLGLAEGYAVEVHSALSSFGQVAGGAPTVIEALMQVVGPTGALIMSAYPVSPAVPLTDAERARDITWKVRKLPADSHQKTGMGAIVETFEQRLDVVCGSGIHRVCAWGHDAQQHSGGYQHLLALDGWVLLLGVTIHRCSSLHLGEDVPLPEAISRIWRVPEHIRRDYPEDEWAVGYGETPNDAWQTVWNEAEQQGMICQQQIGQAECFLFQAKPLVEIYRDMRRNDPFGLFEIDPDNE